MLQSGAGPAELTARVSVSPGPATEPELLTITITIRNAGPAPAVGVSMQNPVPSFLELLAVRSSQGECSVVEDVITWQIGELPVDGDAAVTVVARQLRAMAGADMVAAAMQNRDR